jgi:hypothetical protein
VGNLNLHDKLGLGVASLCVGAVVWMFNSFVTKDVYAEDKEQHRAELIQARLDDAYDHYYNRLDDYEESLAEGRNGLAREYKLQMERLAAFICEHDPKWERC